MPLALLIGAAFDRLLIPGLRGLQTAPVQNAPDTAESAGDATPATITPATITAASQESAAATLERHAPATRRLTHWLPGAIAVYLLLYTSIGAFSYSFELLQKRLLSRDERTAMQWVATHTPPGARFVVITGDEVWEDKTSEWFPVLAQRRSLATIQGYEWLSDGQFAQRWNRLEALQRCAGRDAACLADWSAQTRQDFTDVYLCKATQADAPRRLALDLLRQSLRHNPAYAVAYDGPGATVFVHSQRG